MNRISNNENCVDCIKKHRIFKYLSEEDLLLVNKSRVEIKYHEGEIIFKQGTPLTHIISITKGLAKVYIEGIDKKNLILQYIRPTDFLGGPGAFVDKIHHYSVSAVEETTACLIELETFKKLIHSNVDFAFGYVEDVSRKSIYNFDKFICLTQKQMHGRVAQTLLYFQDYIYKNNLEGFPFERKDIAEFTALSKDSVSRILSSLSDSGIIKISENKIKIIDRLQVEKISNKG